MTRGLLALALPLAGCLRAPAAPEGEDLPPDAAATAPCAPAEATPFAVVVEDAGRPDRDWLVRARMCDGAPYLLLGAPAPVGVRFALADTRAILLAQAPPDAELRALGRGRAGTVVALLASEVELAVVQVELASGATTTLVDGPARVPAGPAFVQGDGATVVFGAATSVWRVTATTERAAPGSPVGSDLPAPVLAAAAASQSTLGAGWVLALADQDRFLDDGTSNTVQDSACACDRVVGSAGGRPPSGLAVATLAVEPLPSGAARRLWLRTTDHPHTLDLPVTGHTVRAVGGGAPDGDSLVLALAVEGDQLVTARPGIARTLVAGDIRTTALPAGSVGASTRVVVGRFDDGSPRAYVLTPASPAQPGAVACVVVPDNGSMPMSCAVP